MIFIGVEVEEEFEYLVVDPFRARSVTVNFVNYANGLKPLVECFAEHPSSLCLWATDGISEQQDTIDHLHDSLHLGTKVGVTWCVDDVNGIFLAILWVDPLNRKILSLNGNAFFTFEIHRVHRALLHFLVFTIGTTLLEQAVHQSGLAVVNVGDDSDITDVFGVHRKEASSN